MKDQLIKPTQETLVKCDNPSCDYSVLNENKDPNNPKLEEYLNKPCPKCGENLLTEKDYKDFLRMMKFVNLINKVARVSGLKAKEDSEQVKVSVGCHNGKYTVKIKEDEQKDR